MIHLFLTYLLMFGVKSNLILSGTGSVTLSREKQNIKFRVFNTLFVAGGAFVFLILSFILKNYIYKPFELEYLEIPIIVVLVILYNMFVSKMFSKMSNYIYYVYDSSYSFLIDSVFILFVVFSISLSETILGQLMLALAVFLIIFVSSMIFGFYTEEANKSNISKYYLNVPARLILISIFSILLHYASLLIK